MRVDIADAAPEERMTVNKGEDFRLRRDGGGRQVRESGQHGDPLTQGAQSQFADDEGVRQNPTGLEQLGQRRVSGPQVINPYRSIDQDHAPAGRRLGGALRSGSLAPNRASRRALSRSMSALSASRTRLDFSFRPVRAWALATSSSSSASVVRICRSPTWRRTYHQTMPKTMPRLRGPRLRRGQVPSNLGAVALDPPTRFYALGTMA